MAKSISHKAVETYPVGEFVSVYTGREPFLNDHIIQDRKILPGMAYLEIARSAVAAMVTLSDRHIIVLADSFFIRPMIVSGKCTVTVKVYPGARAEFGVEVSTDQGVHFQSKAYIQELPENSSEADLSAGLDIFALEQQCAVAGPTRQQFYDDFNAKGIRIGPSLRGIETIRLGKDCALVTVCLPGAADRGMVLDVGVLDGFIQSSDVLSDNPERVGIPYAVMQTKIYGPLTDRMVGYIVKTDQGADFTIADEDGRVKVAITDFIGREFESRQDGLVFYKPQWQEEEPADRQGGADVTTITGQADYAGLVKTVFSTARKLILGKTDQHILDVRLPEDKPSWQGIVAMLKTISLEYPKIDWRLKRGGKSLRLDYETVNMPTDAVTRWQDNKTVLITGGFGGLGRLIARDIAESSNGCTLILTGRSALNGGGEAFIQDIEALGAKIIHAQCDVTRQDQVNALVAQYPGITGVIHGSGINRDNYIVNKKPEEIDKVLGPKVDGLANLDRATADLKLDYFVTLSSIAGAMGNAGQADYAAANGYMDAYIRDRALQVRHGRRQGKSISINWGLWESEGMQIDEAAKENMMQVHRVKPLPARSGLAVLRQIISSDHQQLVVLYGNKKAIALMFEKTKSGAGKARPQKRATAYETDKLVRQIVREIKILVAAQLKHRPDRLEETADWVKFGYDSISLAGFVNQVNTRFELNLMPTVFFEATSIQLFSQYLADNFPDRMAKKLALTGKERSVTPSAPAEDEHMPSSTFARTLRKAYKTSAVYREKDIAVVGVSCRIAGARDLEAFWRMLDEGKDMFTEIPRERWDWRDYPDTSKWGSFIDGVEEFDPLFFDISPAEAVYMAPEQRLMMQYVWECLEDAGYGGDTLKGTNTGLFVGCGPSNYNYFLDALPVEAYTATGFVPSVGPNRISYLMDWHGPSNPVETACSSALVAVHRAVEAIHAGHCDQALAGGVNLLLSPDGYVSFSKSGMLCDDGKCKTFSDKANGYVRGEGIGMLMLKPLQAAVQDGDVIYALIKGTAENHGGRTNSLTAPNPKSQSAVIKKAVRDADMDFSRISYIECHGTGTSLGDPVEIQGLKMVAADLLKDNDGIQTCKLGSIKSNIGHLEYGAGVVGLIKVILQMKHGKIAKSLHCDNINPYIDLSGTHFEIAQTAGDWTVPPGQTRVAGVSSFGFGGVNAHIVVEEFRDNSPRPPRDEENPPGPAPPSRLLIVSARTRERLLEYMARFSDFIRTLDKSPATLKQVAYTLQLGRSQMQERVAFVATSLDEWAELIEVFLREKGNVYNRHIFSGSVKSNAADNLVIGDTQAGRNYIRELMEANESDKLAELWVKGTEIDWRQLYVQ